MAHIIERLNEADGGTAEDVALLNSVAAQIRGKCLCLLGDFATEAVVSGIERFPDDFKLPVS
jgi:NADH-quinone oxidoreductase subunit F